MKILLEINDKLAHRFKTDKLQFEKELKIKKLTWEDYFRYLFDWYHCRGKMEKNDN